MLTRGPAFFWPCCRSLRKYATLARRVAAADSCRVALQYVSLAGLALQYACSLGRYRLTRLRLFVLSAFLVGYVRENAKRIPEWKSTGGPSVRPSWAALDPFSRLWRSVADYMNKTAKLGKQDQQRTLEVSRRRMRRS